MITVFTATYNRKKDLTNLYDSLCNQTYKDFEWIIFDDGSLDDTFSFVQRIKKDNLINIKYFYQDNKGKHVAFNKGIQLAEGSLFICVDSDDVLTLNALFEINKLYEKYKNISNICGFVFLKGYDENQPVTKMFNKYESVENYNDYTINAGIIGDKAEVFLTDVLKKYSFPQYDDEKFLAEGFLWSKIGRKYNYVFKNEIIYLCKYLPGGLTKSGRSLRFNNPLGGLTHAYEYLDLKEYSLKVVLKNCILYDIYKHLTKKKYGFVPEKLNKRGALILLMNFPAFIIYNYWKLQID